MIKEIALHNASNADITDYPIAEAVLDSEGNPRIDSDTQQPITTGETHVWTLLAGETKIFPAYVANYLRFIYGFLEEVEVPKDAIVEEEVEEGVEEKVSLRKNTDGPLKCKTCGQEFVNIKGLGMHIAAKHPEMLM